MTTSNQPKASTILANGISAYEGGSRLFFSVNNVVDELFKDVKQIVEYGYFTNAGEDKTISALSKYFDQIVEPTNKGNTND